MRNEKGQTMVEYMLLLAVSIGLVMTFANSEFFKRNFGSEGALAKKIKLEYEFGYRHAYLTNNAGDISRDPSSAQEHPSYYQTSGSDTRFFGPQDIYP